MERGLSIKQSGLRKAFVMGRAGDLCSLGSQACWLGPHLTYSSTDSPGGFTAGPLAFHQEDPGLRAPELAHATTLTTMSFHIREQTRAQSAPKLPQEFLSNWGEKGFPASQARSVWAPLLRRQFSDAPGRGCYPGSRSHCHCRGYFLEWSEEGVKKAGHAARRSTTGLHVPLPSGEP